MKILLSRTEEENRRSAERIAALGFEPVSLPLGKFIETDNPIQWENCDGIILTSSAVVAILKQRGISLPKQIRFYVCGERTAQDLKEAGISEAEIVCETAGALAGKLVAKFFGTKARLLYLAGRDRAFDFTEAFAGTGIFLELTEVYSVERIDPGKKVIQAALEEACGGVQLHYSAASATFFFELIKKYGLQTASKTMSAVAISQKTALAVDNLLVKSVKNAKIPTQDGMLEILRQFSGR